MDTNYLRVPGGTLAYDDQGEGPIVFCVPGMGDLRGQFRYLTPQLLTAGFRVVTMDLRGHGETSVRWDDYSVSAVGSDVLNLVRHLDAGPAVVIGNSMASGAAVWAAVEAPDLLRGLVMIGPAVHGDPSILLQSVIHLLFARPWGPSAWLGYFSSLFPTRKPDDWMAYRTLLKSNLAERGRIGALKRMMLASKAASEARMSHLGAPAIVVMGSKDPDFKQPEKEARFVAEATKARYRMIDGAGHYPHVEMPEVTGPIIIDFLESLVRGDANGATAC